MKSKLLRFFFVIALRLCKIGVFPLDSVFAHLGQKTGYTVEWLKYLHRIINSFSSGSKSHQKQLFALLVQNSQGKPTLRKKASLERIFMPFEDQNSILKEPNIISSVFYFIFLNKTIPDLGMETLKNRWGPVVNCHRA